MKTWGQTATALKTFFALGSTTIATCWKATLTNGTVVAATSYDRDIVFEGVTYLSTAAYSPSDVESSADLSPDNLELEGFLSSPHITATDLHSGVWDFAAIEIFEVNYKDLTMGRNRVREGTLGEVKGRRNKFTAELRGLTQAYSRTIVRLVTKECPWDLGSVQCGVDLNGGSPTMTVTGTIDSVTSNRQFTDAVRTEAADWFTAGLITFTSGLNNGLSMEVKESTAAGVITLQELMPFDIVAGDTYSMYAGCLKRKDEDCIAKFDNLVNATAGGFGGFSMLPGQRIYAGPDS